MDDPNTEDSNTEYLNLAGSTNFVDPYTANSDIVPTDPIVELWTSSTISFVTAPINALSLPSTKVAPSRICRDCDTETFPSQNGENNSTANHLLFPEHLPYQGNSLRLGNSNIDDTA